MVAQLCEYTKSIELYTFKTAVSKNGARQKKFYT